MIFLRGDLHGGAAEELQHLTEEAHPELYRCTKEDYLIILGDFGCIWRQQRDAKEVELLDRIKAFPWTTLFFTGNHENMDRLYSDEFEECPMFGGTVKKIYDDIYMLQYGQHYTIDERTFFVVPGAPSIDKFRRVRGVSWWETEELSHTQWKEVIKAAKKLKKVDYILAHDVPTSVWFDLRQLHWAASTTSKGLEEVTKVLQCKAGFSGHYHMDKLYSDHNWRVLYNQPIELKG